MGDDLRWLEPLLALVVGFLLGRWSSRSAPAPEDRAAVERNLARISPQARAEMEREVQQRRTIAAIKICRADTGLGLKEAKEVVDMLAARHRR